MDIDNKEENEEHDITYFEQVLQSLRQAADVPLQQKRMEIHNPDPIEELLEVYDDIKEVESNLNQAIEIGYYILFKNKELLTNNYDLQEEIEIMDLERITLEEQNNFSNDNI